MFNQTLSRLSIKALLLIGIFVGSFHAQAAIEDEIRNCQTSAQCIGFALLNFIKSYVSGAGNTVQLFSASGCHPMTAVVSAFIDDRDYNAYNGSVQSCQIAAQTIQAKGQQLQSGRFRGQCFEISPASGLDSIKNACLSFLTK
ncbi:MAG: hypothetical protein KBD78_02955 [Oligoflexales bacterium]|nr:hypothetical protein [Oligoflexales bacterium]